MAGLRDFRKASMKNCLLHEYFFLAHDVNALGQVLCSFGCIGVALQEHAVYGVDLDYIVGLADDFNVRYVVDYAVNADCLVNRAAKVLHTCHVDISAAAGYEHRRA